jgi:hypothetical protein
MTKRAATKTDAIGKIGLAIAEPACRLAGSDTVCWRNSDLQSFC